MNFEGFKSLIQRVAQEWWTLAQREIIEIDNVKKYLQNSPFSAQETPENASAYERLMDSRCKLFVRLYDYNNIVIKLIILPQNLFHLIT